VGVACVSRIVRRRVPQLLTALAVALAVTVVAARAGADPALPGQPTNVTARAGDHLAEVSWDAPTPDDPSITGYTVTASPPDVAATDADAAARTATVTGLTNGIDYTFTVTATNSSGTGLPSTASDAVTSTPPAATSLTLAISRSRILHGGSVWLNGTLRDDKGGGLDGKTVMIEQRRRGTSAWSTLATRTTTGDGRISPLQVFPRAHMHYRLRHAATPFHAASASGLGVILVGMRLSARLNASKIAPGRSAVLGGSVVPAHHGQLVRLQQKLGRAWRSVQAKRLASNGAYRFLLKPGRSGSTWWRVHKASDADHLGAVSSISRLVVMPKSKPKAKPKPSNCDPSYPGVCLKDGTGDWDCKSGSGNGPNFVQGPVRVLPPDPFGLDGDGDGVGCE
jgi:fibronectin type III domain protein